MILNIRERLERRRARRVYLHGERHCADLYGRLDHATDPHHRAGLLRDLSHLTADLAAIHQRAWGPHPTQWDGTQDGTDILDTQAQLLELLSMSEIFPHAEVRLRAREMGARSDEVDLWVMLAGTRDRQARAEVIDDLGEVIEAESGEQVAETLTRVANSELRACGLLSTPQQWRMSRSRLAIAGVFTAVGAVQVLEVVFG